MKLAKAQQKERDELSGRLDETAGKLREAQEKFNAFAVKAHDELKAALTKYNESVQEAWEALDEPRAEYEQAREAALDFASAIVSDAESEWDDRSERWQESEAGEQHNAFKEAWDEVVNGPLGNAVEIKEPEELELAEPEELELIEPQDGYQPFADAPLDSKDA